MMNIVFCCDKNDFKPAIISMISVLESNKDVNIYLLSDYIDTEVIEKVESHYSTHINCVNIDYTRLKQVTGVKAAYLKILIPEVLPELAKALYLDSDVIVFDKLDELYNTDIECVGACRNINDYNHETLLHPVMLNGKKREHKDYKCYFNSGVLLINCDYWRKNNISNCVISENIINPDVFCDQDALNAVCKDIVTELPLKYNIKTNFWLNNSIQSMLLTIPNIIEYMYEPVILHYATRQKPWGIIGWVGPWKKYYDIFISIVGEKYIMQHVEYDIKPGTVIKIQEISDRVNNYNKIKFKYWQ